MKEIRRQVDKIDSQLIDLLAKRLDLSKECGKLKKAQGHPVQDKVREAQIFMHVQHKAKELGLDPVYAQSVYVLILAESRSVQNESCA